MLPVSGQSRIAFDASAANCIRKTNNVHQSGYSIRIRSRFICKLRRRFSAAETGLNGRPATLNFTRARSPELRVHYTTIGKPDGIPVLVLHGSAVRRKVCWTPAFAGELFELGSHSTRKSITSSFRTGLVMESRQTIGRAEDQISAIQLPEVVYAQYRLLAEGLAIEHVRLIIGNSMGGMHVWLWGEKYPEYMDALVPMASQPTAMASRNWMLRRIMLEFIRQDPEYAAGKYTKPLNSVGLASVFFGIATAGGTLNIKSRPHAGAGRQIGGCSSCCRHDRRCKRFHLAVGVIG